MQKQRFNKNFFVFLLSPFVFIYWLSVFIRNFFYKHHIFKTKSLPCKVISVGNITVGGSGKTPTVEYLSRLLQSKGIKVGIISRGYGRKSKKTLIVTDGLIKPKSWENFGDEPYLLAQNLENIPIVVGRSRYEAGIKMIENFNPDIIIIDDGFQHLSLYRDLDIVLVNSKDTPAIHQLIPAGKLREPLSNLSRADLIILTKSNIHEPSNYLIKTIEMMNLQFIYNKIELDDVLLGFKIENQTLDKIKQQKIYIFSALGDQKGFNKTMENTGAIIVGHSRYPDHHHYTSNDLKNIVKKAKNNGASFLITTEKDMVKINDYSGSLDLFSIRVKLFFEPEDLLNNYLER